MSFLYKNEELAKLLVNSGYLNSLVSNAQQTENSVKQVAMKLVDNLRNQFGLSSTEHNSNPFHKDISGGLDNFLNFLKDKVVSFNMIPIVSDNENSIPKDDVLKYNALYIYKDGLLEYLRKLNSDPLTKGNAVLLKQEADKVFGDYIDSDKLESAPEEKAKQETKEPDKSAPSKEQQNPATQNAYQIANFIFKKQPDMIPAIKASLPFPSRTTIYISKISDFSKYTQHLTTDAEVAQVLGNTSVIIMQKGERINEDIAKWYNLVRSSNARGVVLQDAVDFSLSDIENSEANFVRSFGNDIASAIEAATILKDLTDNAKGLLNTLLDNESIKLLLSESLLEAHASIASNYSIRLDQTRSYAILQTTRGK